MKSSFAALSSVVVVAFCIGQVQADTVTTPLGLTQVDDKGVPITPLTYLNLAPASADLADAAKKVTTPPPMIKQKRLMPTGDDLQPFVEQFTSQGISIKRAELGHSLIPSLPVLGNLDNEGSYTNAAPPAAQRRFLDAIKSLEPSEDTQYLPENHQTLGQATPHPLNRRSDDPLNLQILGQGVPSLLPTKLPGSKRGKSSGLNLFGEDIPIDAIQIPQIPGQKRDDSPVDLGLKTGNQEDLDSAKSLLEGLLPMKRDEPVDLGLKTGNAQDMERAKDFLGGLLSGGKRDSITPSNIDLSSVKALGESFGQQAAKDAIPLALAPVKQTASPAVQGLKTAEALCTSFGCQQAVQGAVGGVTKQLPVPLPQARKLGEKDPFADGLLGNDGYVAGVPVKRDQNPVTATVLDTSDKARDAILNLKTEADDAAGAFVKNMYTKHGEIQTKRSLTIPGYTLLPGMGPEAKKYADEAKADVQEAIDFIGLPLPGAKRMEKVRRRV